MRKQNQWAWALAACLMMSGAASVDAQTTPAERNAAMIETINQPTIGFSDAVVGKEKGAQSFMCQFYASEESMFVDDNIEVSYKVAGAEDVMAAQCCPTLIITVKNRTNKILYLDLANTFLVSGDDSQPYYVPSETQTVQGSVKTTTQNQGAITDAIGIRGAIGKIAHGRDVSKEKVNVSTTTVFAQRVISIPPRQSKQLEEMRMFRKDAKDGIICHTSSSDVDYISLKMNVGEALEWDESTSPLQWGGFVTYAFDEALTKEGGTVGGTLYLRKAWGLALPMFSMTSYGTWKSRNFTGLDAGRVFFPMNNYMLSGRQLQTWGGTLTK